MPFWAPPTLRAMFKNMLGMGDPEHRRLRKLVDKAFARRGIRDMRPRIAAKAERRAASLVEGTVDIVPGFSRRFRLEVIAELLGVPEQDPRGLQDTAVHWEKCRDRFRSGACSATCRGCTKT